MLGMSVFAWPADQPLVPHAYGILRVGGLLCYADFVLAWTWPADLVACARSLGSSVGGLLCAGLRLAGGMYCLTDVDFNR